MKINADHRRHAIQIVSALPNDTEDALIVLDLARQLVEGFLSGNQPPQPAKATVVTLVRDGQDLSA
jgi:hypothetical protein